MLEQTTLDKLLKFGVGHGASDVHFEVEAPPFYRIKGELLKAKYRSLTPEATLNIAKIVLGDHKIDLEESFPELDVSYSIPGVSRFRVSIFRQRGSIGCVMRVIPFEIRSAEELGLPQTVEEIASGSRGLVLVTGPTGMGKSTTIAAMLQHVNETRKVHIITIEDPIEFLFENSRSMIIQREIGTDTQSFKTGLGSALRQDPDIIMLGEIRDEEAAETCLKAAETGHLVVSTVHTLEATTTIKRFAGLLGHENANLGRLAETLRAIISLRLLPRAGGKGVVPAVEILLSTPTIQEAIRDPAKHSTIVEHIAKGRELYGMQTFDQHLSELVRAGTIKIETARIAASKPDELERAMMLE